MVRTDSCAAAIRRAAAAVLGVVALAGSVQAGAFVGARSGVDGVVFAPAAASFGANSGNWAGWVAAAHHTSVVASWRQPAVTCRARETSDSAFWIGLDGYGSGSVEQVGTQSGCANGTAFYSAWTEFYPAPSKTMSTTVRPGDRLHASVTFLAGHDYRLVLTDATRNWTRTVSGTANRSTNASVEVVTEAPTDARTGKVMALSHFDAIRFTGVTVDRTPLNRLAGRQQLVMGSQQRVMADTSTVDSAQSFSVSWHAAAG